MSGKINDDFYRIQKIGFYCQAIVDFTTNKHYEELRYDNQLKFAIPFALDQISEEATKLTEKFRKKHHQIPWRKIIGIRRKIIHDYEGSNIILLWEFVKESIPELLTEINQILNRSD